MRCGRGAASLSRSISRDAVCGSGSSTSADEPFRGSRGKGIQPRTQEIFDDLGILDRIVARGGVYPSQREYRSDGSYAESNITGAAGADARGAVSTFRS